MTTVRWPIDDVLARTDLTALLNDLADRATYNTRVRRWRCPVPDHDDQRASVSIYTDNRGHERWRCWSGNDDHRGDAVDLVRFARGVSKADAIDWLATRAGMIPEVLPAPVVRTAASAPVERKVVPLDPVVVRYVEACERILWGPTGRPVREWLHGRGFDDDLLRANRVGCDPGRSMMRRQNGLAYGRSLAAVFPALNEISEVHYAQTRYLDPAGGPKYENPSANLGTNPRLAWARCVGEPRSNLLVVCEGIPDTLSGAALGHRSVGFLGANGVAPNSVLRIIEQAALTDAKIVVVPDRDRAGGVMAETLMNHLTVAGVEATVIPLTDGIHDLNDWMRTSTPSLELVPP
jgi:hypothetical protein